MREVQAGHHDWSTTHEHGGGCFGIEPDVELRGWGAVSESTTAHERDSLHPLCQVGGTSERKSNIGERASGHQPHVVTRPHRVDDEVDGPSRLSRARWLGKDRTIHAALAVHIIGKHRRLHQRLVGARVQRRRRATEIQDDPRISGGELQWCIPRNGGDSEQVRELGCHDQGECVVMPRIAIENDVHTLRHYARA